MFMPFGPFSFVRLCLAVVCFDWQRDAAVHGPNVAAHKVANLIKSSVNSLPPPAVHWDCFRFNMLLSIGSCLNLCWIFLLKGLENWRYREHVLSNISFFCSQLISRCEYFVPFFTLCPVLACFSESPTSIEALHLRNACSCTPCCRDHF